MAMNKDFLMGFVSGTVVGAVGYRLYEQNSGQLKQLIQQAPSPVNFGGANNNATAGNTSVPSVEELVAQKERLEDLIAEKQASDNA